MTEPGFSINSEFYPLPTGFRLGDPVLVSEVTGLDWQDFAELLDNGDPRATTGLIAVAVWQKHPGWRRDKVVRFVESLDVTSLQFDGGSDDAGPPPVAATTEGSAAPLTPLSDTPGPSDEQILASSGAPG